MTHIEAIFQVDHGMFLLSKINEKLSVKKTTIEKMIDNACGYDDTGELVIAERDALNMIIEGKKLLECDYSKETELLSKVNDWIKKYG